MLLCIHISNSIFICIFCLVYFDVELHTRYVVSRYRYIYIYIHKVYIYFNSENSCVVGLCKYIDYI